MNIINFNYSLIVIFYSYQTYLYIYITYYIIVIFYNFKNDTYNTMFLVIIDVYYSNEWPYSPCCYKLIKLEDGITS